MAESPQTTVKIYINKYIDKTYNNILNFTSTQERNDFFNSTNVTLLKSYTDMQYLRKDSFVDIDALYDEVQNANYIIYNNNEGYGEHYAFIYKIEFLNFNCTRIYYKTDLYNENLNNIIFTDRNVLYERHHDNPLEYSNLIADVEVKAHLPLSLGYAFTSKYYMIVMFVERSDLAPDDNPTGLAQICEQLTPLIWITPEAGTGASELNTSFVEVQKMLYSPYVYAAYMCEIPVQVYNYIRTDSMFPITRIQKDLIPNLLPGLYPDFFGITASGVNTSFTVRNIPLPSPTLASKSEYKLNTYPYSYYRFQTNEGSVDLSNYYLGTSPTVSITYNIASTGISIMYSLNTNGIINRLYDHAIAPITQYDNQLIEHVSANKYSTYQTIAQGFFQSVTGLAIMGLGMGATSTVSMSNMSNLPIPAGSAIQDTYISSPNMQQVGMGINRSTTAAKNLKQVATKFMDMAEAPIQGTPSGDYYISSLNIPIGNMRVTKYGLNSSQAEKIKDYYAVMGYQIGAVEPFKLRRRKYYDYVKTSGYVFIGECEPSEKERIELIFNNGVSLWHYNGGDFLEFGNYPDNEKNIVV